MKKAIYLSIIFAAFATHIYAQNVVLHPYNSTTARTYTLNSGQGTAYFHYYDDGGPTGNYNYSSNTYATGFNSIVTFVPANPTDKVQVQFSAFSVKSGIDAMFVFDGLNTSAPKIASPNYSVCNYGTGGWWGTTAPNNVSANIVRATGATGALTFAFCSYFGGGTPAGWSAIVTSVCATSGLNNAGVVSIDTFSQFCAGTKPVHATIQNFGTNNLTSATVEWTFDGVPQTPVPWSGTLVPCGSGTSKASVLLGNKSWAANETHIVKAWTTIPNGVADPTPANDTSTVSLAVGLAGTYTLGGASPNFASFSTALAALKTRGVCGSVIFNVRNGTYSGKILVEPVPGASASNTITFQSESGDSTQVILTHNSNGQFGDVPLYLEGADWFRFKKMTIQATNPNNNTAIRMTHAATNNQIWNNVIEGVSTTNSANDALIHVRSDFDNCHNNSIQYNRIVSSYSGVSFSHAFYVNSPAIQGVEVKNNIFENQYLGAILGALLLNPNISGNTINANGTSSPHYSGINLGSINNGAEIIANKIIIANGAYGIRTNGVIGVSNTNRCLIANNYIELGGTNPGPGYAYGITTESSYFQDFLFNTVRLTNTDPDSRTIYLYNFSNSEQISFKNNILFNAAGGPVFGEILGVVSDYNNLFTTGGILISTPTNYATLAEWQAATSKDLHSISINPGFPAPGNIHPTAIELNGAALPQATVSTDIEGQTRHATLPDIGADEFTPANNDAKMTAFSSPQMPFAAGSQPVTTVLKNNGGNTITSATINWTVNNVAQPVFNWSGSLASAASDTVTLGNYTFTANVAHNLVAWSSNPNGVTDTYQPNDTARVNNLYAALAGVYTIGGASPDFTNFTNAVAALHQRGVSAAVTFNVRNGTYTEQISINQILGVDSLKNVTFQSESGDSSLVILRYAATNSTNQHTLQLYGADWFTFRKMTIECTGSFYGYAVALNFNAKNNAIKNCLLKGAAGTVHSLFTNISSGQTTYYNDNALFQNNRFQGGDVGISFNGSNTKGLKIINNVFENQGNSGAIFLQSLDAPIVESNIITSNTASTSYKGMNVSANNNSIIRNNKVFNLNACNVGISIFLYGTNTKQALVANNYVQIGSANATTGIELGGSYFNVLHNSIHISNTNSESRAYWLNGDNSNISNNIFCNTGGGYAMAFSGSFSNTNLINDNCLYTSGSNLIKSGSVNLNLAAWRTATGFDLNSISIDPYFITTGNFKVASIDLNNTANPSILVTTDIEGETRSATTPDIGADEFVPLSLDATLTQFSSPVVPFLPGVQDVAVSLKNNGTTTLTSATIHWLLNGATQSPVAWSGSLASGGTATISLGNPVFPALSANTLKAWVNNPNGGTDLFSPNDTARLNSVFPALAGIYTIGGTSPDFANFTAAVNALNTYGVAGAVTFNVRNGTYSEQIVINQIAGASASNTITFQSESGDSSQVILTWNSGSTLQMNGSDWLRFKKLTLRATGASFGLVLNLYAGACQNIFENVAFKGVSTTSTSSNFTVINSPQDVIGRDTANIIRNCRIENGSNAIVMSSYYSYPNYVLDRGWIIENNTFIGQSYYVIALYGFEAPIIQGNTITSTTANTSYFGGIYLNKCDKAFKVLNNKINLSSGVPLGVFLDYCNENENGSTRGLIANNFVRVGGASDAWGIYLSNTNFTDIYSNSVHHTSSGGGSVCGIYSGSSFGSNSLNVKNNIFHASADKPAYFIIYYPPVSFQSDNNDLFTTGATLATSYTTNYATLAAWQTATGKDANSLSVNPNFVSATDLHTFNAALNGEGTPIAGITHDIDGDLRHATLPDIGADEFPVTNEDAGVSLVSAPVKPFPVGSNAVKITLFNKGLGNLTSVTVNWKVNGVLQTPHNWSGNLLYNQSAANVTVGNFSFVEGTAYQIQAWTSNPNGIADTLNLNDTASVSNLYAALSGTYTIGGASPNFNTFQAAVTAMNNGGVLGAVTFNVRNGEYDEQLSILPISGASASNTITFQSETGDSTQVVLKYGSTAAASNFTLQLDGADWFKFKKMTLKATGASFARVVEIRGGASDNHFENNEFIGAAVNDAGSQFALVYSADGKDDNTKLLNNRLLEGSTGIYLTGAGSSAASSESGTVVQGNRLEGQYAQGIFLQMQNAPWVLENEVFSPAHQTNFAGIRVAISRNDLKINRNHIHDLASGYGIRVGGQVGTSALPGLLANNFVHVGNGGTAACTGIEISESNYFDVFHNNVNCVSQNDGNTLAFQASNASNLGVKNNAFANADKGQAYFKTGGSNVISNYNDLFTQAGTSLGTWGATTTANLSAWQTASGQDANSVSLSPGYVSASDLHVSANGLNNTGTLLAAVTDDFDGETRSLTTPDIGADEFASGCVPTTEVCNGLDDDCNGSPEAAVNTWTGSGDGINWNHAPNWSDAIVPLPCQGVVIPATANVTVPAGYTAVGKSLDVAANAQLNVVLTAILDILP